MLLHMGIAMKRRLAGAGPQGTQVWASARSNRHACVPSAAGGSQPTGLNALSKLPGSGEQPPTQEAPSPTPTANEVASRSSPAGEHAAQQKVTLTGAARRVLRRLLLQRQLNLAASRLPGGLIPRNQHAAEVSLCTMAAAALAVEFCALLAAVASAVKGQEHVCLPVRYVRRTSEARLEAAFRVPLLDAHGVPGRGTTVLRLLALVVRSHHRAAYSAVGVTLGALELEVRQPAA